MTTQRNDVTPIAALSQINTLGRIAFPLDRKLIPETANAPLQSSKGASPFDKSSFK